MYSHLRKIHRVPITPRETNSCANIKQKENKIIAERDQKPNYGEKKKEEDFLRTFNDVTDFHNPYNIRIIAVRRVRADESSLE